MRQRTSTNTLVAIHEPPPHLTPPPQPQPLTLPHPVVTPPRILSPPPARNRMSTKLEILVLSSILDASTINAWLNLCQDSFEVHAAVNSSTLKPTIQIVLAGITAVFINVGTTHSHALCEN